MQTGIPILAAALLASSLPVAAAEPQPLQVRALSYSLFFHRATSRRSPSSIVDSLDISSQGRFAMPGDGELALAPPEIPYTHWGSFHFHDGQLFETFGFFFNLDIPTDDGNNNGVPDILEYSQASSGDTFGEYELDGEPGAFLAEWSKAANSHTGTCKITFDFTNPRFFQHTFEVFDFNGPLTSVTKADGNMTGQVTLTRAGVPEQKLNGQLAFSLATPGEIALTSNSLTFEGGAPFTWDNPEQLERDGDEFFQFLNVMDGRPEDAYQNFHEWLFTLTDPNDWDNDGTPDLIDPPTGGPSEPRLDIIKTPNGIRLVITAETGFTFTLEQASALPATQWTNPVTVTVTSSPHMIDLPAPSGPTFWRLRYP